MLRSRPCRRTLPRLQKRAPLQCYQPCSTTSPFGFSFSCMCLGLIRPFANMVSLPR